MWVTGDEEIGKVAPSDLSEQMRSKFKMTARLAEHLAADMAKAAEALGSVVVFVDEDLISADALAGLLSRLEDSSADLSRLAAHARMSAAARMAS